MDDCDGNGFCDNGFAAMAMASRNVNFPPKRGRLLTSQGTEWYLCDMRPTPCPTLYGGETMRTPRTHPCPSSVAKAPRLLCQLAIALYGGEDPIPTFPSMGRSKMLPSLDP